MAIFTVDISSIKNLIKKLSSSKLGSELYRVSDDKSIAAEIGQGIAENFAKEGPGWKALKTQTIRRSVNKKVSRQLSQMTDKEIIKHEEKSRKKENEFHKDMRKLGLVKRNSPVFRKILQRTGLLKRSATIPGDTNNIYRPRLGKIEWGTNLKYARAHNQGYPAGGIPKRQFLVLRGLHLGNIYKIVARRMKEIVWKSINK